MSCIKLLFNWLLLSAFQLNPLAEFTFDRIKPKGFRISVPNLRNVIIIQVHFHVNINKPIEPPQPGHFSAIITKPLGNHWVYDEINAYIEPESVIYFWEESQIVDSKNDNSTTPSIAYYSDSVVATGHSSEIIDFCSNFTNDFPSTDTHVKESPNCQLSATTVGNKPTCKGQLIFEENFEILNFTRWRREAKMPSDSFASYQRRIENCYISKSILNIKPTLRSNVPGFSESRIRTGSLRLKSCTGAANKPYECHRQAKFSQILPPIVSANIHTKNSFSFRYGEIEIRAKLPEGDWITPLLLLEPLENYYGEKDYASGQIRIATVDSVPKKKRGRDGNLTATAVFGTFVISGDNRLSSLGLSGRVPLDPGFHVYNLRWTEDYMAFGLDGAAYAYVPGDFSRIYRGDKNTKLWSKGNRMAPFDREFFLSLGVSVGGHFNFVDGNPDKTWQNNDPKAMLDFWKDRPNWIKTWTSPELEVDYIKVYAL